MKKAFLRQATNHSLLMLSIALLRGLLRMKKAFLRQTTNHSLLMLSITLLRGLLDIVNSPGDLGLLCTIRK